MSTELDAFIVRNLRDVEAFSKHLRRNIERRVFKEIDVLTEAWLRTKGWHGTCDWLDSQLTVHPPAWENEDGVPKAWHQLWYGFGDGETDNDDVFYLTRLCQAGQGSLGWRWYRGSQFGPPSTTKRWKELANRFVRPLTAGGFVWSDQEGAFMLPVALNPEHLARAIENEAIAEALAPIEDSLTRLSDATPVFQQMFDDTAATFGSRVKTLEQPTAQNGRRRQRE